MAKSSTKKATPTVVVADGIDRTLLAAIGSGTVTEVNREQAMSAGLLYPNPENPTPLIEVGAVDMAKGTAPVRITELGTAYLNAEAAPANVAAAETTAETFGIISGVTLPPSKRGNTGGGAPIKYPFDKLEVGQSFFVPKSAKLPNPVKTLGSTVSSAIMRYATDTGETKQVTRAKREGKKAALDANGEKIMETVTRSVYKFERKFTIRGVEKGVSYGSWTAPEDGAIIARVAVE